jgi:hypothetical protein
MLETHQGQATDSSASRNAGREICLRPKELDFRSDDRDRAERPTEYLSLAVDALACQGKENFVVKIIVAKAAAAWDSARIAFGAVGWPAMQAAARPRRRRRRARARAPPPRLPPPPPRRPTLRLGDAALKSSTPS